MIVGGGGLYLALSEEVISTDVLPPIKKLKNQMELITAEVAALKNENDKITKMYANLKEENKKTSSELAKTVEEKTQLYKYSQDLLAEKDRAIEEKNRAVEEKEVFYQYTRDLLAEKNQTMNKLSESQLEALSYKSRLTFIEVKTLEIESALKQKTENNTSFEKMLEDYFNQIKSWRQE